MSTQSQTFSDSLGSPAAPPSLLAAVRPFYWSVRRELWEYRSLYIAPLVSAAVLLVGFLISLPGLPRRMRAAMLLDPQHQRDAITQHFDIAAGLIMGVAIFVVAFYCLTALHGERRDRSILFWKSLPVSDWTTVLSKLSIPLFVLPMIAFGITVATQWIMLLLSSAVLAMSGLSVSNFWTQLAFFQTSFGLLYHLLTVHALWYAPFYGWLLLVSVWARRAAFLWAVLPPFAIGVVEKIAFNTTHFGNFLLDRLRGGAEAINMGGADKLPIGPMMHFTPGHFLLSPGLWVGFAVTAVFLVAAVRLRRYREPL